MSRTPDRRVADGRARARGFSLVEIMVALLISAIVLLTVFFVFITNTEQYYRQEQVVQMQERMRFAMEYLKNDLRNAGRLTMVNGNLVVGPQQVQGVKAVQALELFEEDVAPGNLGQNGNGLRPDRLRILVDASGGVPLGVTSVSPDRVTVSPELQQRGAAAKQLVAAGARERFEALFADGSYVYLLHPPSGRYSMVPVRSSTFQDAGPTIEITEDSLMGATCGAGECMVNPVQIIEYRVAVDPDDAQRTNLYRRPIHAVTEQPMDPAVIIAEYVVDMQLWGTYDIGVPGLPQIPADPNPTDTQGNWPAGTESARLNQSPHRVRAMNVLLAVRTPREDKSFVAAPGRAVAADQRVAADRTWFDVLPGDDTGLARVSTLVSEVETPNLNRGI
ncbi:MAG: prepilin-type N-terminal cleavage/methylation domain-containing protein [Myxococcales bacterium]|nr:prepilin-type N-terminal cleavage/methylation domain-containing protein [Myxococcales bacterium]MCB9521919.1 prepilin-type N-terminal cleavage/methylation domain-containing protein [Myxococcales bacterium]